MLSSIVSSRLNCPISAHVVAQVLSLLLVISTRVSFVQYEPCVSAIVGFVRLIVLSPFESVPMLCCLRSCRLPGSFLSSFVLLFVSFVSSRLVHLVPLVLRWLLVSFDSTSISSTSLSSQVVHRSSCRPQGVFVPGTCRLLCLFVLRRVVVSVHLGLHLVSCQLIGSIRSLTRVMWARLLWQPAMIPISKDPVYTEEVRRIYGDLLGSHRNSVVLAPRLVVKEVYPVRLSSCRIVLAH